MAGEDAGHATQVKEFFQRLVPLLDSRLRGNDEEKKRI